MSAIHPDPKKVTRGGLAILTALYDIGVKHAIENFGSGFMPHQFSIVSGLIIFVGSRLIAAICCPNGVCLDSLLRSGLTISINKTVQ
jgi:hypothetical protein